MNRPRRSLRHAVAVTTGAALLAVALIAILIATLTYQASYNRSADDRGTLVARDYQEKFRNIAQEWDEHLMREKSRLEFSRLLENPVGRWDRLRAYLATLSDSPLYAGLTICGNDGQALFRQGPATFCPAPKSGSSHLRHYLLDTQDSLIIELDAPVWLGPDGMGTMHLAIPLDHAFLWRSASPDIELFIEWGGRIIAGSGGETHLAFGQPGYEGRVDRAGGRYEQRRIALPGERDPPHLLIQTQVPPPFSVAESVAIAIGVFTLIALLLGLVLRRWLANFLPRLEHLAQAMRLYADQGQPSAEIDGLLKKAAGTGSDELTEVTLASINMVAALSLREQLRTQADTGLRLAEQRFREVAKFIGTFVWEIDAQQTINYVSDGAAEVFGLPVGQLMGSHFLDYMPPEEHAPFMKRVTQMALAGEPFRRLEATIMRTDGTRRRIAFSGTPVIGANGRGKGTYRGIAEDLTQRKLDTEHLRLAEKVFENSAQAIMVADATAHIVSVNPAFTEITGYRADEVIGAKPSKFASGRHDANFYAIMWNALNRDGYWAGEIWNRRKNGAVFPVWLTINAVRDEDTGAVAHHVAIFSDITEQKESAARIEHLAYHDPLTGLPNRYALNVHLAQSLADARRNNTNLAVMFIDLDRFKTINDSLGHDVGDQLLIAVAQRIRGALREADTVARLGGDEFVVVAGIAGPDDAARVAEKIVAEVGEPLVLAGHALHTSPSIGIGLFPTDGNDADTLMKNADTAMYYAKQHGRNNFHFFTADLNAATSERLLLETQLHHALDRRQFFLVFQPQVEIHTGRVVGVETLVRWQHPDHGEILPGRFIPVAEEIGLIVPLGTWILEEACREAMTWGAGTSRLRVAVNVSVHQLEERRLAQHVAETLARTGLPADRLELEITESAMMRHPEVAIEMLRSLAALGVRLAIDDFGTGYSSLSYLKRLPNSRLKIDRSFVMDLETDTNDVAITEGIIALARSLGLAVTAVGIETPVQLDMLKSFGCVEGQGFLFSKPLSSEALHELLVTGGGAESSATVPTATATAPPRNLH